MTVSTAKRKRLVTVLLERHGRTFSEELGLDLGRNKPSPLFRWLCAALLMSARISAGQAIAAARALAHAGWRTPQAMAASTWRERVRVLNRAGYARYDESTARMLADSTAWLLSEYKGDLRRLRRAAGEDPAEERRRLKAFKGIGDVGADIFFREMQLAWDELYPFADRKACAAAQPLGLPARPRELARLVPKKQFPRLVTALVRADLARDLEAVREAAASK
ncbi:MAG: hypothetical protein RIC93_09095 [Alphaproteobacteria bacterium]